MTTQLINHVGTLTMQYWTFYRSNYATMVNLWTELLYRWDGKKSQLQQWSPNRPFLSACEFWGFHDGLQNQIMIYSTGTLTQTRRHDNWSILHSWTTDLKFMVYHNVIRYHDGSTLQPWLPNEVAFITPWEWGLMVWEWGLMAWEWGCCLSKVTEG